MKKNLFTLLALFAFVFASAQIDRSKQPASGPAPKINLGTPETFDLKNGLTVMVVENHKLPRVSIQLSMDNPPIAEGDKSGVSSMVSSLLGKGSTNISKDAYNDEVDYMGASISFGSQSGFASCLSKYFPRVMEMFSDAALNPNFTQEEFDKEKEILLTGLKTQEKDVSAIAGRVQSALAYGKSHPYGEFTTAETVNNITLADTKKFYRDYFVPANAYMVIIGDVEFKDVKKLVKKYFNDWTKATPPSLSFSEPKDAQYTQINFVDMPNAVQSEVTVQNLVDLKMKNTDYLDALLANRILGGGAEGRLFLNLREDKGYTYGSYSSLGNDKNSKVRFRAFASVRNAVTDSSVVQILEEINKISTTPVTEEELANAKAGYAGSFVRSLESPQTLANFAYNIATEGLPSNFYETYLERLDAVTIDDVQMAAQKYMSADNARVVVVGKGADVIDNLEKIEFNGKNVPVLFYDKTAKKTEKPVFEIPVPDGVTATTVLEAYVAAAGGKDKLESIESYLMQAEAEMQGMVLELEMKKAPKGKFMQDIRMMGNSVQKQVIDGDKGYAMGQGQKRELTPEEIEKAKDDASTFPELNWLALGNVSLEGIEKIDGKAAYKLKVTDNKHVFYDVESGLKVLEVSTIEAQGQQFEQKMSLSDYKEVSGIQFPFMLVQSVGPQTFEFKVKEIKVNEGVTDADFN